MNEAPTFAQPYDIKGRTSRDGQNTVSYGLDSNLLVEFYRENVHMEYLSKVTGHPIFEERIFTRIVMPGNRLTIVVHPTKGVTYETVQDPTSGEVHSDYTLMDQQENGDQIEPEKYPNAWARFMKKDTGAVDGHPIEEWGTVTRSFAASLKMQNIHTLEALASLSDSQAQNIMGGMKYRDLAKAQLDDNERTRIIARDQERASAAEERNTILQSQIDNLRQEVMRLQSERNGGVDSTQHNRMQGGIIGQELGQLNAQRSTEQGLKKVSLADAKKKHHLPPGKPGEAA